MAKKISKAWKAFERTIATFFGTTRTPLSGGNSKVTRSDTFHDELFIECKTRQSLSHHTLFKETAILAKQENKIPILVTKEKNKKGFLICIHCDDLHDFINIYRKQKRITNDKEGKDGKENKST